MGFRPARTYQLYLGRLAGGSIVLGKEKTGCLPVILKGGCTIPFQLQPPRVRMIVVGGEGLFDAAAGSVPLFVHICKFVYSY